MAVSPRRDIDAERVRTLAAASAGRIGIVALPMPGRPRFVLDLGYATAGSSAYPRERQASSRIAIELAPRHPFQPPLTTVLTPIYHPHVFTSGIVCIGAKWLPGEGMDLFVRRIVRLLAFDPLLMNPNSIAHGAANAWYRGALQRHPEAFPTDPAAAAPAPGEAAAPARAAAASTARVIRNCPRCDAALRLPAGTIGNRRLSALRTRFRGQHLMRWIDAPEPPALRTLAEWQQAMCHDADAATLRSLAERARGLAGAGPIVALASSALAAAWNHVCDSALERGGLLIGEPIAKTDGEAAPALVYVRAAVAGLDDEATSLSLRLRTGVWDAARAVLRPGEVVVGWFHSHPGIGAFFSGTDRRTQAGFFHHAFSLGWVIDPQRREQAWFVGRGSDSLANDRVVMVAETAIREG